MDFVEGGGLILAEGWWWLDFVEGLCAKL